jgi:transposase
LSQLVSPWILALLKSWVDLLRALDEKIQQAKVALAQRYQGPRPKGLGAASLVQLSAEVLDWQRYSRGRKIGCLAGMVPSEWSTGDSHRLGAITKVDVPAFRRIITEAVWRIILFQPQYKPVQKWQEVLSGTNRALKTLVPLERCVSGIMRCHKLTCRIGGCLAPLEQRTTEHQEETFTRVVTRSSF